MPIIALHSPVGDLTIAEEDGSIVSLDWGWPAHLDPSSLLEKARDQLVAYFEGNLTAFDLPLAPHGTDFQKKVWAIMSRIPLGQTRTYGDVAKELGSSPRAVGTACGRNPIPILIPCHRIVGVNGNLGGYSGWDGIETKQALLTLEGVS